MFVIRWAYGPIKSISVLSSAAECQRTYIRERNRSGLGASEFGSGDVFEMVEGQEVYAGTISYNGRLWPSPVWTPGLRPLAEPPAEAVA